MEKYTDLNDKCFERTKTMHEAVKETIDSKLQKLDDIWEDIGLIGSKKAQRSETVLYHVDLLLDQMVHEEENTRQNLLDNIAKFRKKLDTLCRDLSLSAAQLPSLSPVELHSHLKCKCDELEKEKKERLQQLSTLQNEEQHLCDMVCETPVYIRSGSIPSEEQLQEVRQNIEKLKNVKDERFSQFTSCKERLINLLEELEQAPDTSLAANIMADDEHLSLSKETLQSLDRYQKELEDKSNQNFKLSGHLRTELNSLWDRIDVTDEERETFNAKHSGFKPSAITALKQEIARCKLLRLENIQLVIEKTREELTGLWDKCFISQEERNLFKPFFSEDYSEALLENHEQQLERQRDYYKNNKSLLDDVAEWQQKWQDFLEFEKETSDPNRLITGNRRGCNLLQEEKRRKEFNKTLPKIANAVRRKIDTWEAQHGTSFKVDGVRFTEYIETQERNHHLRKEHEKQQRHMAKNKQLQEEMIYGSKPVTTPKRHFHTPAKSPGHRLRKFNDTQKTPGSISRLGRTQHSAFLSPVTPTPRSITKPNISRRAAPGQSFSRRPMTRSAMARQALKDHNPNPQHTNVPMARVAARSVTENDALFSHTTVSSNVTAHKLANASLASIGQYQDFAKGLNQNSRPNCRSSVIPEEKKRKVAYF